MKKRNFVPAFFICLQLGPVSAQTGTDSLSPGLLPEVKVQLLSPQGGGLVEATAVVVKEDAVPKSVTIPAGIPSKDPVTASIKDPSNFILQANKIAAQLPAQVLATRTSALRYEAKAIGSGAMNDFEHFRRRLVSDQIAAREDYKQVKAAFDEARLAFDEARLAYDKDRMAEFLVARLTLTEKLISALETIEDSYARIAAKKEARSAYDIDTQIHFVRFADGLRSDLATLRRMIGSTSVGMVEAINKAVYGYDDNFEVFNVKQISDNAPAIALVRNKMAPSTPIGTAFLIGKNVIVTAEHCVGWYRDRDLMGDLEFVFFHEYESVGGIAAEREKIVCTYKQSAGEKYGSDENLGESFGKPDFAVLEISPPAAKRVHIEGIKPLTLSLRRAHYGDALCSIGHPMGQHKKIHMNCRVLLPFELRPRERGLLAMHLASKGGELNKLRNQGDQRQTIEIGESLILQHYTPNQDDPINADFRYHVDRTNGLQRPAIAIEADTFPGDSGAPILDIRSNAVVGILVAGQPTSNVAIKEVSLDKHEVVLPIQFVISAKGGKQGIEAIGGAITTEPE